MFHAAERRVAAHELDDGRLVALDRLKDRGQLPYYRLTVGGFVVWHGHGEYRALGAFRRTRSALAD